MISPLHLTPLTITVILIQRLKFRYGIGGTALAWLASYLENREQRLVVKDAVSKSFPLSLGVPQGSVMGPLEFILYTGPLSDTIKSLHGIHHMIYADDIQLYVLLSRTEQHSSLNEIEKCIADVQSWATANKLMFNMPKNPSSSTSPRAFGIHALLNVQINGNVVSVSDSVRDLGVMLHNKLENGSAHS